MDDGAGQQDAAEVGQGVFVVLSESLDSEPRFIKLTGELASEQTLSFDVDRD